MSQRAPPDERLCDLVHLDGGHHTRVDLLLFERILQGDTVDDGGEHAHVISCHAVHTTCLHRHPAKEISATYHDGNLASQHVNIFDLFRDLMDADRVHTES